MKDLWSIVDSSWAWILELLGAKVYFQHAICLTNDPIIMSFYVAGDLVIWGSYMIIGISVLWKGMPSLSSKAISLYGAFIFLCGLSHLSKTLTLFSGVYRLDVLVVLLTASVSLFTAWITVSDRITGRIRL